MKKIILMTVFLFTAALIFSQNPTAVIREITGTVEIKRGSADWAPAVRGAQVAKGNIISTGFRSTAVLAVGSSVITVRPLTRLSLEDLMNQNNTETINVNLNTGRIRAEVASPSGTRADFTVQSPSATASVRGTIFEMDPFSIQVMEGAVSYEPAAGIANRPVTVSAGQATWIDSETGAALLPMTAAENSGALSNLFGQHDINENIARFQAPVNGTLDVGIILEPKGE